MGATKPAQRDNSPRVPSLIALLHPIPSAVTVGCGVCFAVLFAGGDLSAPRLGLFTFMVALHQIATSLHNDLCDRDLDAIAKPWRALPSRAVSPTTVAVLAATCALVSLVVAAWLGPIVLLLDSAALAVSAAYNAILKRTSFSWLPFLAGFPLLPLAGAATFGRMPHAWWSLFVVGAPVVLAIHLADTLPDLDTDIAADVKGLAHRLGKVGTRRACLLALASAVSLGCVNGFVFHAVASTIGAAVGAVALGIAAWRPQNHRVAATAGAAAVALGWVAALARTTTS